MSVERRPLPPGVTAAIESAARRYDELHSENRHLHFESTGEGLIVEVRDLEGNLLGRVTPAAALAVAAGAALEL